MNSVNKIHILILLTMLNCQSSSNQNFDKYYDFDLFEMKPIKRTSQSKNYVIIKTFNDSKIELEYFLKPDTTNMLLYKNKRNNFYHFTNDRYYEKEISKHKGFANYRYYIFNKNYIILFYLSGSISENKFHFYKIITPLNDNKQNVAEYFSQKGFSYDEMLNIDSDSLYRLNNKIDYIYEFDHLKQFCKIFDVQEKEYIVNDVSGKLEHHVYNSQSIGSPFTLAWF